MRLNCILEPIRTAQDHVANVTGSEIESFAYSLVISLVVWGQPRHQMEVPVQITVA